MFRVLLLKRNLLKFFEIAVLLFSILISIGAITKEQTLAMPTSAVFQKTVILDAGHGGFDGGAVANDGTLEKDINLEITLKLKQYFLQGGFNVITIRETDTGIEDDPNLSIAKRKVSDMKKRLNIINSNQNATYISIHLNKFTTSAPKGAQVFYSKNLNESKSLAECLQYRISMQLQTDNKRVVKPADKSIYLLNNAQIPAVIVECGFLSNSSDLKNLKSEEYQNKLAFSIYSGFLDYYN